MVRMSKYKNIFAKGYEANFTEEIFKINYKKVFRGDPIVYEIVYANDEPVVGKFYKQKLSPVNKEDDQKC